MKKQTAIYVGSAVIFMSISFLLGFFFSNAPAIKKPAPAITQNAGFGEKINNIEAATDKTKDEYSAASSVLDKNYLDKNVLDYDGNVSESHPPAAEKITASTKMVYEYYYLGDGKVETTEEAPPYFLLDMTEQEIGDTFADWKILSFNSSEVIMRKDIEGKSNQYYIIGEHEGYIAVFYENETSGITLKEITNMPVSVYDESEQERLRSGIHVSGKTELIRVLQDYGS